MNILSFLTGGAGAIINGVDKLAGRFVANKDAVESNVHDEQMAATAAQAAEFQYRGRRTWFDSLIDGINRLPRPMMAFGILYLFYWCGKDPAEFTIFMTALSVMPEWLAIVIGQAVLLYMGGRMLNDWKMGKAAGADQVRQVLALQEELRAVKAAAQPKPKMSDDALATEMRDTSKPLSDDAIATWNRKRQAGKP